MLDNADANTPSHDEGSRSAAPDYLKRAMAACDQGDAVLGMYLYLAAFEEAVGAGEPSEAAITGLKQAWSLACEHKERSLAEYIFERMEPYLSADEMSLCADELQNLALDKLEEYGLSRAELEDMAQMITQDFLGLDSRVVKVEHVISRPLSSSRVKDASADDGLGSANAGRGAASACLPSGGEGALGDADASAGADGAAAEDASLPSASSDEASGAGADQAHKVPASPAEYLAQVAKEMDVKLAEEAEELTYANLAGYKEAIQIMRGLGVGLQGDEDFQRLVGLLNARHGLDRMPALDTMLFRSPAREDANRFIAATIGELGLPVLRMHMEENIQGMPLLCVTAQASDAPKLNLVRNAFEGGGVLVLEDIDLWGAPVADQAEDAGSFLMMQLSRGAREAVNLIRSAVENPDVYVLASASLEGEIDGFFLDMLEPLSFVDIELPTPEERVDIWMDIAHEHPSIRAVNRADLVRLSANMPRYDIYMAAREAVEESYKMGLMMRRYQPVTRKNLFDKLAAYQPLDSREYHELEEAVVSDFRADLSHLEDLLAGE